ncbi:MAG: hypothetical protein M3O77_07095 [Chloroflexota bacterium]|nr:hypothetical protein [Chloroflexota bacterium]
MSEVAGPLSTRALEEHGPALLRPLRDRDFRLLFGGETASLAGFAWGLPARMETAAD